MTTRKDLLTMADAPDRLHFATGMLLEADDFQQEQAYHRGRLARALAYLHGSGTAAGLFVVHEPAIEPETDDAFPQGREERLRVEPGLAVDRLGRLIEIQRDHCIRLNRWYEGEPADRLVQGLHGAPYNGVVADLFVRFVTCERGLTPAFAVGPFDALDAVSPSRLRDGFELELVVRTEPDPPVPEAPWPDFASLPEAERKQALRQAIFDAWREGTSSSDEGGLDPLSEHAVGQDTTSLLLARMTLPATAPGSEGERPQRTEAAPVLVDNDIRPFAYAVGALARWLAL